MGFVKQPCTTVSNRRIQKIVNIRKRMGKTVVVILAVCAALIAIIGTQVDARVKRALPPCYLQCPHDECRSQCLVDHGSYQALDVDCFAKCNPDCMRNVCGSDV